MKKYEFSIPMPESTHLIKKIKEMNNQVEKSEITSLYYALPLTCLDNTGFEELRTTRKDLDSYEVYQKYFESVMENGFDFIYLLNSPKPFINNDDFLKRQFEKLDKLINNFKRLGFNKYRVGTVQLFSYLQHNYPDLELYASTSIEYHTLRQYTNLINMFSNITEIVPAVDLNKDFKFLKNFKKRYPNVTVELMVADGCMYSCPLRIFHHLSNLRHYTELNCSNAEYGFFIRNCAPYIYNDFYWNLCNHNIIYPWEIKDYGEIGINNFKLIGRNEPRFNTGEFLEYYLTYLKGIDDIKNIENEPIWKFNHYFIGNKEITATVKDVMPYLPNIKHFKKNGHLCASSCGVECNYCRKCAEKIEKDLDYMFLFKN